MIDILIIDILLFFGVFRLSRLLVAEQGFFGIFDSIRTIAGVYEKSVETTNVVGQPVMRTVYDADNTIGKILTCFYCCSVWVAAVAAIVPVLLSPQDSLHVIVWFIIHWLALSGGAIFIKESGQ